MEQSKPTTVNVQAKIEERHRQVGQRTIDLLEMNLDEFFQVKENHERMQQERDSKRKQTQARKEAEAQARLVVLKVR